MNLNMIRPKNETEDLLLSISKNCETLFKQRHKRTIKAKETLDFKISQPRETFHFNPPISILGCWMLGLTSLEVNDSFFNITKKKTNLNLIQNYLTSFHSKKN